MLSSKQSTKKASARGSKQAKSTITLLGAIKVNTVTADELIAQEARKFVQSLMKMNEGWASYNFVHDYKEMSAFYKVVKTIITAEGSCKN